MNYLHMRTCSWITNELFHMALDNGDGDGIAADGQLHVDEVHDQSNILSQYQLSQGNLHRK